MRIDEALARFVTSPVMIMIGTRNGDKRPAIARGVGARLVDDTPLGIAVSAWQWPDTVANMRGNGRTAVTFARPADYVSYQITGMVSVREALPADLALVRDYCTAVAAGG